MSIDVRPDGSFRMRPTWTARISILWPLGVNTAMLAAFGQMTPRWYVIYGAIATVLLLVVRHNGITLRRDEAVIHRVFRRAVRVPWSAVQAITLERTALSGSQVAIWTDERRCLELTAPAALLRSRKVAATVDVIGNWWLAHRGQGWRPAWTYPPPHPPAPPGFNPWAPPAS